jgi:hypothetical protein
MWLPPGLINDVLDRDAGLSPQHLEHQILLALRRRRTAFQIGKDVSFSLRRGFAAPVLRRWRTLADA